MGTVISGVSYDLTNRMIPGDGLLVSLAEHFMDDMIVDWQMKHPMVFRDRVPMGKMPLFNGFSQKAYIYKGTLGPQSGLSGWTKVEPSRKPADADVGVNRCSYNPQTYTWGFDEITFEGLQTSWRSTVFCVKELMYQDRAQQQLAMILKSGFQITDQIKETYSREMYLKTAADAGRFTLLLGGGGLDYVDATTNRVTYNPLTSTNLTFNHSVLDRLSTLNFTQLDLIHQYLEDSCPDAALSMQDGRAVYGLMLDLNDFEQYALTDDEIREDFRHAIPMQLIKGFDMSFRVYRGWAFIHDPRQPRWALATDDGTTVTCTRVNPRRATRPGIIGYIPETDPNYIMAPLGAMTVFMNNVIQILVPSVVDSLGTGMTFGPAPDFNGSWKWLNIQNEDTNPVNEIGYFFSRYEYFCKLLEYSQDCHVILYRRCKQSLKTQCPAELTSSAKDTQSLLNIPASGDFSATNFTVVLTLAGNLTGGEGDQVTIKKDNGDSFTANIADDSNAPTYKFVWNTGTTNAPSAVGDMNDPAIVTVTVV